VEEKQGLVVRCHGGHHYVEDEGGALIDCLLRGRLKKRRATSDLVAIGDHVRWSSTAPGEGMIEEVLPRRSALSRCPPPPRAQMEQVIVANLDQVLIVFASANPPLSPLMLDRYLVACEAAELPAYIIVNKMDLVADSEGDPLADYRRIGYPVHYTSVLSGEGLAPLRALCQGRISVLTGPSGVGKSSLFNALWPGFDLATGEISQARDRGVHTTVVARLLSPQPGTYIADTPGMRQFRLWHIAPEQLPSLFPEMRPFLGACQFEPCSHLHEPGCAVREAVARGEISALRYESYSKMVGYRF
jgi:ribosome biogenesis GTPase